jgi:hypothetical protein
MVQVSCAITLQTGRHLGSSYACGAPCAESCAECGSAVCQLHAEECDRCQSILCSSCYDQHVGRAHTKTVQSARGSRKSRRLA